RRADRPDTEAERPVRHLMPPLLPLPRLREWVAKQPDGRVRAAPQGNVVQAGNAEAFLRDQRDGSATLLSRQPVSPLRRFFRRSRITLFCYVALLPVLVLFFYVRIIPIGFSFLLSFYKWNLISPRKPFVGWDNYLGLLEDENFLLALKNTTIY